MKQIKLFEIRKKDNNMILIKKDDFDDLEGLVECDELDDLVVVDELLLILVIYETLCDECFEDDLVVVDHKALKEEMI
jgi:hypothetical protein